MGEAYKAAFARFPAIPPSVLRDQQRAWLANSNKSCPAKTADAVECIRSTYDDRLGELTQMGVPAGPYTFGRFDLQFATEGQDATEAHAAYPQILTPVTPQIQAWNLSTGIEFRDFGKESEEGCKTDVKYEIKLATIKVINVYWEDFEYCQGKAHGYGGSHNETWVLWPTLHALTAADIFRPDARWKDELIDHAVAGVKAAERQEGREQSGAFNAKFLADIVSDPSRWTLTPENLVIQFDMYELGEGYAFAPTVSIRWAELKDVLASNTVAP